MVPFFAARHVEAAVSPEKALEAVRDAFVAYRLGEWSMPPKVYVPAYPAGDFRAMPALGAGHAALNIQGRVELLPPNPGATLPRYDQLEFRLLRFEVDGQEVSRIVCEGVVVDPPARRARR